MPKVKAKVLQTQNKDGRLLAKLQFDQKLPGEGTVVSVKWGSTRTSQQNSLLWVYYEWIRKNCGLEENHGYISSEALHINVKGHLISQKIMSKGEWKIVEEGSTADMNKVEFGLFFDKVNAWVMDFFGLDTSGFWDEYMDNHKP